MKTQLNQYFEDDKVFEIFLDKMKEKLPCIFRINTANPFWNDFRKILTLTIVKNFHCLTIVKSPYHLTKVSTPYCLTIVKDLYCLTIIKNPYCLTTVQKP